MKVPCVCFFAALLSAAAWEIQTPVKQDAWMPYRFLLGEWIGEGSGDPGRGTGSFSFNLDLDGRILVRKNHVEYPQAPGRPAAIHDDLMVVYPDSRTGGVRAIYWDNEGHSIEYTAEFNAAQNVLQFVSEPVPAAPRYRLSYRKVKDNSLQIKFEIAPPGKPDAFSTYLEGGAHRK